MSEAIERPVLMDTSAGLIGRVQAGDDASWQAFCGRCQAVLADWCRWNRVREPDAEDVSQEAMLVVVSKSAGFRHSGRGSLRAWLRAIAWRCWCEAISKADRGDLSELAARYRQATSEIAAIEQEYERLTQVDILERAMAVVRTKVQPRTWEAFWQTAMEGGTGADVGARLDMSADCVHSARARVQRLISVEVRRLNNVVPRNGD
ncbi:MAG: RNA polymerase sigma factor [Planctomyces sp.]